MALFSNFICTPKIKVVAIAIIILSLVLHIRLLIFARDSSCTYVNMYNDTKDTKKLLCSPPSPVAAMEKLKAEQHVKDRAHGRLAVVTALSSNHFMEVKDAVASMQTNLPSHDIIVYDLGLNPAQIKQIKTWRHVKLKVLDFARYPLHVKNHLFSCAWKPIIIYEVLGEYKKVVWFDASVRITCQDWVETVEKELKSRPILLFDVTGHSIFAATDPRMYAFLPAVKDAPLWKTMMFGAGLMAIQNSRETNNTLIYPWVHCALNQACIDPPHSTNGCRFKPNHFVQYANCHRYDQSAINILLHNKYNGSTKHYVMQNKCFTIKRSPTSEFTLQIHPT